MSNFPDYSAALTETILLGNLAVWAAQNGAGPKLLWDAQKLRVANGGDVAEQVARLISPSYRPGYSL
jgi:hypothetical protein